MQIVKQVCLFYCLSGFVSLGYQVVWFRTYVDQFGSTNLTFVLVLCNFIGGLGVGALASQRVVQRLAAWLQTDDWLRLYGVVELLVVATVGLSAASWRIPADAWGTFPYVLHDGIYAADAALSTFQGRDSGQRHLRGLFLHGRDVSATLLRASAAITGFPRCCTPGTRSARAAVSWSANLSFCRTSVTTDRCGFSWL